MTQDMITRIQGKWGKIKAVTLKKMGSDPQELVRMLQTTYGYTRNRAERECHEFQLTLRKAIRPGMTFERFEPPPRRF